MGKQTVAKRRQVKPPVIDRWKPVRAGLVYCSPACGRGCMRAEYDRAVLKATRLAQRLGPGWRTRVWENLGWHWCVYSPNGWVEVSGGDRHFTAWALHQKFTAGGSPIASGTTPAKALLALQAVMATQADQYVLAADRVTKAMSVKLQLKAAGYRGKYDAMLCR
jgi:hypothetical protein